MSGYILCQIKRAQHPYYIESISLNIYSIEELCYFLFHNLYLLDDSILNTELCDWIRDELGLRKLSGRLYTLLEKWENREVEIALSDFILPVLKEINYLTLDEFRTLNLHLATYEGQPDIMREKLKGDCLVGHGKYVNAIQVYQHTLEHTKDTKLGGQFKGSIFNNMGCAYMRLFQTEEALDCFKQAYENLHSRTSLKSYLFAFYMSRPFGEYEKKLVELGVDGETAQEVLKEIQESKSDFGSSDVARKYEEALGYKQAGDTLLYQKTMDELLEKLTKEYHKNTGL